MLQILHLVSSKGQRLQRFTESEYHAEKNISQAAVFKGLQTAPKCTKSA
jgi:hypothetical protein